ncbi:MAG: hypothetical protein A3C02_03855 [Candidatus Andersenbacteria bacterium RIFCSPHIGHO2_02_FULL_45_11]|uniref:Alpha/beta hydrolase n=1 Tax=Candidatus Andersenbacteria bacterium RIFCSPHIGHO2_12_FULL_45_11 TaxID=1797281 RepID=A0A1G1X4J6_9BACT|nr:MAG: hypothetical protein A3C02_03855 [Candidatus Andersenbacteria bacterium RIFCSPHIGHO2_02_FULL_45_11]OGY34500.1 MAG: hypothetical protein A3D99_03325 [Candidatus Andersenbacteria bacterium RIFCSPHIGHO2_12_FULL_45_11]
MKLFIALDTNEYNLEKGVTPINLTWKHNGIKDWCSNAKFTRNDIVMGHSIGAAIALIVAEKNPPKELHLYSPSPIFTETVNLPGKNFLRLIGKKRRKEILPIPSVTCSVTVYVGELEHPAMKKTAEIIARKLHAKLVVISGKNHKNILEEIA